MNEQRGDGLTTMSDTEQPPWSCPVCNSDDFDSDSKRCVECNRLICFDCIHWVGEDHDEPNGEWFCEDCIEGNNERHE
jgi:hypothetical protein